MCKYTLAALAMLLALAVTAAAQQKEVPTCTVRILLEAQAWDRASPSEELMSSDQMKWWLEDGQKKFKNFCFVSASQPYDYRILCAYTTTYQTRSVPVTTTSAGTVSSGNKTGTYSETSTTNNARDITYETLWVRVELFKADPGVEARPVFNKLHKGKGIWSKLDRAALENALEALSKLTKARK
jgi:hypothetical protein